MRSSACWNASLRVAVVQVPDERVDAVEDEDREQLAPPVEAMTVAQGPTAREPPVERRRCGRAGSSGGPSCSTTLMMRGVAVSDRLRRPVDGRRRRRREPGVVVVGGAARPRTPGAPSRLTTSVMPYQRSPTPIALPVGTPSGRSSSTSRPSRMPRPESEIGRACAAATAGRNASTAPFGSETPSAWMAQYTAIEHRRPGTRSRRRARRRRPAGLAADAVDADVHRADEAHPVLVLGEAPGQLRAAGDDEDHDQARRRCRRRSPARSRRGRAEQRRLEREADEREERERDEAAQPLDDHRRERDVAGRRWSWRTRLTRSTSPPMVDGSTLPTNWPAR